MKKSIVLSAAVCSMLLAGCGASTSHTKASSSTSKVSTSKVVKSSSVKPDPNASKRKWTYQPAAQSNEAAQAKKAVQSDNGSDAQAQASDDQASEANNDDQIDTAQPSQGGTIYQTDNDGDGFKGDPDAIADTQERMLEGIK